MSLDCRTILSDVVAPKFPLRELQYIPAYPCLFGNRFSGSRIYFTGLHQNWIIKKDYLLSLKNRRLLSFLAHWAVSLGRRHRSRWRWDMEADIRALSLTNLSRFTDSMRVFFPACYLHSILLGMLYCQTLRWFASTILGSCSMMSELCFFGRFDRAFSSLSSMF